MTLASSRPFARVHEADALAETLEKRALLVVDRHEEVQVEYPPLPFSTALLLEEATVGLGWTVARVTDTAQQLFEAGLITYPRTDSTHLAPEAIHAGRQVIAALFGSQAIGQETLAGDHVPPPNPAHTYWWQRLWQVSPSPAEDETPLEAHEAIRPTDPTKQPETLRETLPLDPFALYTLIWTRFLASLMKPARYRVITIALDATP